MYTHPNTYAHINVYIIYVYVYMCVCVKYIKSIKREQKNEE